MSRAGRAGGDPSGAARRRWAFRQWLATARAASEGQGAGRCLRCGAPWQCFGQVFICAACAMEEERGEGL